jgi:hypothetical protein
MRQIEKSIPYVLLAMMFIFLGAASGAAQQKVTGQGKSLAPKETLTGTISMVDKTQDLVVVTGSNGVPYNFRVTRSTRITISGNKAGIDELANQLNKQISVEFIPKTGGNFASSMEVGG